MNEAEQMVNDLLANAGLGTPGVDLFLGPVRPADSDIPKEAIFVMSYDAGRGIVRYHHEDGGYMERPAVQARVRATSYETGVGLAWDVWRTLAAVGSPAGWTVMNPTGTGPEYLGRGGDELLEWSVNLYLTR